MICISTRCSMFIFAFFFFNDTATTEIYTLSLHDALPIFELRGALLGGRARRIRRVAGAFGLRQARSEEHTSELQSHVNLVCRLLLEKKKKKEMLEYHGRLLQSQYMSCIAKIESEISLERS